MSRLDDFLNNKYASALGSTTNSQSTTTNQLPWQLGPATRNVTASNHFPPFYQQIVNADKPATTAGSNLDSAAAHSKFNTFMFQNPPSGTAWLTRLTMEFANGDSASIGTANAMGGMADVLWWNGNMTTTASSSDTINSAAWPARDRNGSTDGEGIQIAFIPWTGFTSVADLTITYTNSAGTGGRTGTIPSLGTSTGTIKFFHLQAGDVGVRSVQSLNKTTVLSSNQFSLLAMRLITQVYTPYNSSLPGASVASAAGVMIAPQKLYNGSVLTDLWRATTSIGSLRTRLGMELSYSSL